LLPLLPLLPLQPLPPLPHAGRRHARFLARLRMPMLISMSRDMAAAMGMAVAVMMAVAEPIAYGQQWLAGPLLPRWPVLAKDKTPHSAS
jgi:hypothetical protein